MRRASNRAVTGILVAGVLVGLGVGHTRAAPLSALCQGAESSDTRIMQLIGKTTNAVELAARRGPCRAGAAKSADGGDRPATR